MFIKFTEARCPPYTFSIPVRKSFPHLRRTQLTATGHSLTIVGFERRKNGTRNLLVFDPIFKPSPGIQRLKGTTFSVAGPERLLKAYRRGEIYLQRYENFELLK